MNITVEVRRGPNKGDISPYIIGRNGYYDITALAILARPQTTPRDDSVVDIRAIGKRGKPINGGFFCLQADDIDALCTQWIEARGGLVVMPDDVTGLIDLSALITSCAGVIDDTVLIGRDLLALENVGQEYVAEGDPHKWEWCGRAVELLATPEQSPDDKAP